MEQEKVKKNSKHFNNNIAHVQYAIKQSKMENSDSKAAETAKHIAGKLNMFKVTKNVASQIKTLSTALASKPVVSNKNNNKVTHPNSFIELSEKSNHPKSFKLLNKKKDSNFRFLEGKRSMKSRKGSIGDQIKAGAHKGWEKAKAEGKTNEAKVTAKKRIIDADASARFAEVAKDHLHNLAQAMSFLEVRENPNKALADSKGLDAQLKKINAMPALVAIIL